MAFKEKEIKKSCVLLFMATIISQMSFVAATNYDCKGKAFYCLNSTHFMICLDLGYGISTTMEDFIIPCPPPTICKESNAFECEYHPTSTLDPLKQSEIEGNEFYVQTLRDDRDYTTFLPFLYNRDDSVKSEKYDMLDDQPYSLTTEYIPNTDSTYSSIEHQTTSGTGITNEFYVETTTHFTQDENENVISTIYSVPENKTLSTKIVHDDEIIVSNQTLEQDSITDRYDRHFDTVSTTTLSESTTQYDELQTSTYSLDTHITSKEGPLSPPVLQLFTYQENVTTHPLEITLTTDFTETENRDIPYEVTTETEKYLNTNSQTISSTPTLQEVDTMLYENVKSEMSYEYTTEINNSINNNTYATTNPLMTFKEESVILKDLIINTSDTFTSELFTNNNSLTTLPEEHNHRKTENSEISYGNNVETNYPTTTEIYENSNIVSVSATEKNTLYDEYIGDVLKTMGVIDEGTSIDVEYVTHSYASQLSNDISLTENMNEETTLFPSTFSPNVYIPNKNAPDITTYNYGIHLDSRLIRPTDKTFLDTISTTLKVTVTPYMMQDTISPFDYTDTVDNTVQYSHASTISIDELRDINDDSTVPVDYQITTDSLLLPIVVENAKRTHIIENKTVPKYSTQDIVTEIIQEKNYEYNTKQGKIKTQEKTNEIFDTSFPQSYDPTIFSPDNDISVMKNTLPVLEDPGISTRLENDLKTLEILDTTTSEPKDNDVHTVREYIEDHTLVTVLRNSPLPNDAFLSDLYNTENSNQYKVTKGINALHHDKSPGIASKTPSINDVHKLKAMTIDNSNFNLEKSVTEPENENNSIRAHVTSSTSYVGSEMFTTSLYANNNVVNNSIVISIENYVSSHLQDENTTESSINIENTTQVFQEQEPVANETRVTEFLTKTFKDSKHINVTNFVEGHSSMLLNTNLTAGEIQKEGKVPVMTGTIINISSTTMPPLPTIAIINGAKTVDIYSENSKPEGIVDVTKLPETIKDTFYSKINTTVGVSHSGNTEKDFPQFSKVSILSNDTLEKIKEMSHNISLEKLEIKGKKENIQPNLDTKKYFQKKESVSVQASEPCNRTKSDIATNQKNVNSNPISSNESNFTCLNRYRGKYSDQNNCQTFYMCIGTVSPVIGQCPQNSVFSDILNQCTRNLSHCIRNNQFQCVAPGRFGDLWVGDTYYICLRQNGKFLRFKLRCQKGYHLNKTSITCIESPVKNVAFSLESYSISSISSSSTDSEQSLSKNEDNEFKCEKEGVFPDPNNCRKFYVCKKISKSKIQVKKKKCDSDEVFNKKKNKCVDEDSYECN